MGPSSPLSISPGVKKKVSAENQIDSHHLHGLISADFQMAIVRLTCCYECFGNTGAKLQPPLTLHIFLNVTHILIYLDN